ncbi:uncharacterized protein LOC131687413, partial [Topomyia yanbarensis]|uniref:uncharacterized protein LOC131687413 n=1 Tax=Topomyia yanbarensis TaxID=2498891 RepID=UPI00273BAA4C
IADYSLINLYYLYTTEARSKAQFSSLSDDPICPSKGSLFVPTINSKSTVSSVVTSLEASSMIVKTQIEFTMDAMRANPKKYMGVSVESFCLIEILIDVTNLTERDLFLILRKIRRDEPYWQLADYFSLSVASVSRIIAENVCIVSEAMEEFIIWPEQNEIQYNLPNSFKHRYAAVNTIIDCFEIQIQKPSNSIHQTLTYSNYKKCNTIKYLIGCLPDGTINFISKGAGGRTSDQELVKRSGFLNKIEANTMIMADRGFKLIEAELRTRKCMLVRPPSTIASETMSKKDVIENKRIASLRIHVERAIGRLREFTILKPHATVDAKLVAKLDFFVTIACGLCNIQGNLIKK